MWQRIPYVYVEALCFIATCGLVGSILGFLLGAHRETTWHKP